MRRNWAATVEHLDQCLGRLVERVGKRGDLENTVVVFTSDHGEMLGDYDQWQKLSPLQASVGVPWQSQARGWLPSVATTLR